MPAPHSSMVVATDFSGDGRFALTAGQDGILCLWDVATMSVVRHLDNRKVAFTAARFTADGTGIMTGDADGRFKIWPVDPLAAAEKYLEEFDRKRVR